MINLISRLLVMAMIFVTVACNSSHHATVAENNQTHTIGIHDGLSFQSAIIITETSESMGIKAEYQWVRENYPGSKQKLQSLIFYDKKPFDVLTIITSAEKELKIYFDISGFYGKF